MCKYKQALQEIINESDEILDGFVEDSDVIRIREIAKNALMGKENTKVYPEKYKFTVQEDPKLTLSPKEGFVYAMNEGEAESEIRERYAKELGIFESSLDVQIEKDLDWKKR